MNPYIQYMYSYPHKTAYRPLTGIHFQDYASMLAGKGHGLYLHIPFCQSKCGYCNLFSVTGLCQEAVDRYLDAVECQSRQYQAVLDSVHTEFSELVIGGGTPLFMTENQLEQMFCVLEKHFRYCGGRDLVVETAPNQTTREKLGILKQSGVSRISMGIQSFNDRELLTLERQHDARKAREALELIKDFDFPCVNVDFIYGIPGQTKASLLESLKEVLRFEPEEIFLYPLYVKHGARMEREGIVLEPETAFAQYQTASSFLREEGFYQDSMRRFVRRDMERTFSECGFGTSIGLGCGGRSYLGNLHFCSPYAITRNECLERLRDYEDTENFLEITHGIILSAEEQKRRYVIRHLLIRPGIEPGRYRELFGKDLLDDFPVLHEWIKQNFASICEEEKHGDSEPRKYFALTERGLGFSDYLGPQLISPEVAKSMHEWEVAHGQTHDSIPRQSEKL
ncbi:MAG: STM4012 family radical SAM protein [Lachnospiraceae bacterium]|nr:STM4012 family radical SAM protein [Lachnospiraceae bacterium]